jgi:calcineurin-like phosphoesterase family protein
VSKTYFWSDPHFGHENIISYCNRPWNSVPEMNEGLIQKYNEVVKEEDTCVWVGDCFFWYKAPKVEQILNRMNGKKILVRGNHDLLSDSAFIRCGFAWVCEEMKMKIGKELVVISHYPYLGEYDERYVDRKHDPKLVPWLIHGHTHSPSDYRSAKGFHVGVDGNNFKPILLDSIANEILKRKNNK